MIIIFQLFQTADEDASFSLALAASRLRPKTKAGTAARTTAATIAMMRDLAIFMVLYGIELFAFSCVGVLCFGNLPSYGNIGTALIMFFQSSFGQWDFDQYDALGDFKFFGVYFHIAAITVNMILMLNLIIAMMSDSYA